MSERGQVSRLQLLAHQFNSSLVWVLIVAATISGLILEEWVDTGVIIAIVILNAVLGYTQENRAEHALAALEAMTAPVALVHRSGVNREIPAADVVPGDILLFEPGDRIAADARLLEAIHVQVNESVLTGESLPVRKHTDAIDADAQMGDRANMIFAGTTVGAGRGSAVVAAIGDQTAFGNIAQLLDVEQPQTPLTVELNRVGKQIAVAAFIIAFVIFGLGIFRDIAAETMFLTAVALAVAAIPEGLPALVTLTLSRGVSDMAEQNAIVRHLPAVEALGATTVICSDKTGTLTKNEIRVQKLEFADLHADSVAGISGGRATRYANIAALCNDAQLVEEHFVGDPTEVALLLSIDPVLVSVAAVRDANPRVDELAFDSTRKMMSTLHATTGDGLLLAAKGAPERLLPRCTMFESAHGAEPLTDDRRSAALADADHLAGLGLRTLALAYRDLETAPADLSSVEDALTLVAIVGMSDEIRPEAKDAVAIARDGGIRVVMITGDHRVTARTIGAELGILDSDEGVLDGDQLRSMSDEELEAAIDGCQVFARVDPADKVSIVHAWQNRDAIVAMTGDGVNDAPALRSADIGVSMGSGTAVAREASAMVLADDNFSTIVAAVKHGRGIFDNLTRVVYFLLSANVSEVFVMLIGFLLFGALGEPLLATQLLWINLVTDGLPALALGADSPRDDVMTRPPRKGHHILGRARQGRLIWQGAVLATGALAAFVYGYVLRDLEFEESRTLLFTALVLVQMPHMFNIRSEGTTGWRIRWGGNRFLIGAVAVSVLLQLGVIYTSIGNELFETNPIAAVDWLALILITAATVVFVRTIIVLADARTDEGAN
ncbi:MAG: cation-translocating P-type ATPase [Acidimicrobiales bacterium]|nr:MAG: cation-translocating P-type ATPase [Acidimicrobiales bacterium]